MEVEEEESKIDSVEAAAPRGSSLKRFQLKEVLIDGPAQGKDTLWVDNLPNDELGLRSMLAEVRRQIQILERQFLIEEDSDAEADE